MSGNDFIPVGRTSLVKKGDTPLQVQTEYASRPVPRITTTISQNGQVVHKVERSLEHPVETTEEQGRVERTLRCQHAEILSIIQKDSTPTTAITAPPVPKTVDEVTQPSMSHSDVLTRSRNDNRPIAEQLAGLPGVQRVYRLNNDGEFIGDENPSDLKRAFAAIFANVRELLGLFERLPGVGITRRKGVYEVERDRLYLVSAGLECFFLLTRRADPEMDYEVAIKRIIDEDFLG